MKKLNILFIIVTTMISCASALVLTTSHINNEYNINNIAENNISLNLTNKETKTSSYQAIVTIFAYDGNSASSSSSFLNFTGHAFITIKNLKSNTIKIGKMDVNAYETVSLGTWGNKNQHKGLWYNLESYFANKGEYNGRVSLSKYTTSKELESLNSYINSHDSWSTLSNCSTFASGAWNTISSTKLSAGWINTPSNLKGNIKKHSYSINRNIEYNNNVGYFDNDTFNYINMNSRTTLDSEMYNPNSL